MASSDKKTDVNFLCNDAIELCLSIEKEGMVYYEKAAKLTKNPKVRAIFNLLAREEKDHTKTLSAKAKFLRPAVQNKSTANEDLEDYLSQEVKGKIFPVSSGKVKEIQVPDTDFEAIELGIESEKRSIDILMKLLKQEKKMDVRVVFSHLLAEEKKHLINLEELKEELLREGA